MTSLSKCCGSHVIEESYGDPGYAKCVGCGSMKKYTKGQWVKVLL